MSPSTIHDTEDRATAANRREPAPVAHRPNGPAAAAILAAGIASAALGLAVILVEMSPAIIKPLLNFYDPVGPLSGKTTVAVLVYAVSWIALGLWARDRSVRFERWAAAAFVLMAVGLVLTFPPIFLLFAPSH